MGKAKAQVYQIKITLRHSRPPIWRRLLVSSDTKLDKLHRIIQEVMGWWDAHLHQFIVRDKFYGEPHPDYSDFVKMHDERKVRLSDIAPGEKSKFVYEYDFGDSWHHDVLVEKALPPDPAQTLPVCIKGRRACPPEDVGGMWGYGTFLEAINNPEDPQHEMYLEWIGGEFDPEAFDLDGVNARLRDLR